MWGLLCHILLNHPAFLFFFKLTFLFIETGSHYVTLPGLDLAM